RMRDEVRDAEPRAALELVDQRARGAPAERLVGRREVEEVAVVSEDRADAARGARRREGPHVVLAERPCRPLPGRAGEELDGLAAGLLTESTPRASRLRVGNANLLRASLSGRPGGS